MIFSVRDLWTDFDHITYLSASFFTLLTSSSYRPLGGQSKVKKNLTSVFYFQGNLGTLKVNTSEKQIIVDFVREYFFLTPYIFKKCLIYIAIVFKIIVVELN